jgi:hypothetical protein
LANSSKDNVLPKRNVPKIEKEAPNRPKDLSDKADPIWTKSNTDIADPRRPKLRSDNDDPICTLSNSDTDEPKRVIPKMERADARRENPRKDIVEAMCT